MEAPSGWAVHHPPPQGMQPIIKDTAVVINQPATCDRLKVAQPDSRIGIRKVEEQHSSINQ